MNRLLLLCCVAQRLEISPRGTQIKTIHTGAVFTCTITDYQQPADWTTGPSIRWLGPGHVPVTATRGRSDTHNLSHFGSINVVMPRPLGRGIKR